jgi:thioredoxin reductase
MLYDAVIVGGGPAGMSAALVLGRCRRRVLLCDTGHPRNEHARATHGFLSRDGISPAEMRRLARAELCRYGVELLEERVLDGRCLGPEEAGRAESTFEVDVESGRKFRSRKLLLATGVIDILPPIEGIEGFYGKSVHHCPYCDGFEHRDQMLAAFGAGPKAIGLALSLRTWSERVFACTHGRQPDAEDIERLRRNQIGLRTEPVVRLEGTGEALERIVFQGGPPLECDAMFFNTDQVQRSNLPAGLGCEYDDAGHVVTASRQQTRRPGLFLAGDASGEVQFVISAAAEGATAGVAMNRELQDEDRGEA